MPFMLLLLVANAALSMHIEVDWWTDEPEEVELAYQTRPGVWFVWYNSVPLLAIYDKKPPYPRYRFVF